MRRAVVLILLFAVAFSLPKSWKILRGPSLRHLVESPLQPATESLSAEVSDALDQPFYAYGRGSQSEVFLSQDGKWVVKIPRDRKVKPWLLGRFYNNERNPLSCLHSYLIAGQVLAEETAVLYLHRGAALPQHFGLYDSLGRKLPLSPDRFLFALQKRKPLLSEQLKRAENELQKQQILSALLDLIERERAKGWVSSDHAFLLNFGYEEGQAFRIDIGSYEPLNENFSLPAIAKPISRYLENESSSLSSWWMRRVLTE